MGAFTEGNVEAILAACSAHAGALAESLSQCFGRSYRIEVGESGLWSPVGIAPQFGGPGVLALIQAETQGIGVLIPATLPLPEWYARPNDSERARLDTLAMEWSLNLLPADVPADQFRSFAVPNLLAAVERMEPSDWAATLELRVVDAATVGSLLVVWPLERPQFEIAESTYAAPSRDSAASNPQPAAPPVDPLARLRGLPVPISVRLAEKKIPLSSLLSITPGMLITFNKSCEELLDLYVSNSRYGRGEAVKIGENFGLKINQVGDTEKPPRKVIEA
jgi:flagellar motor switch protein FliN/FliY